MKPRHLLRTGLMLALGAIPASWTIAPALASNHSDAPLIKQDPQANLTDVYAFIGTRYDNPSINAVDWASATVDFATLDYHAAILEDNGDWLKLWNGPAGKYPDGRLPEGLPTAAAVS